jgi:hypothetical protein
MSKKVLDGVAMGRARASWAAAAEGVLRGAGLFEDENWKLMGTTGMAFHMLAHATCCPSSVTAYDWIYSHTAMLDRIGVWGDIRHAARPNTFAQVQAEAIAQAKASIDRGFGVIVWAPTAPLEFGILRGYDDADGVFLVADATPHPDPLLYANLGKKKIPWLLCQFVHGRAPVDPVATYLESLRFGVAEWKRELQEGASDLATTRGYASGANAYGFIVDSLGRTDLNPFGFAYLVFVYSDSKSCLARYTDFLAREAKPVGGLEDVARAYAGVAEEWAALEKLVPFRGPASQVDGARVPEISRRLAAARDLEARAIAGIERALERG